MYLDAHNYRRRIELFFEKLEKNRTMPDEDKAILIKYKDYLISEGITLGRVGKYLTDLKKASELLGKKFKSAKEEDIAYDPSMLTSMFTAVNTFAQASLGAGVREILMKRTGESEIDDNYKLVRVEESDFSVILIVNESDSMRKSIKIGKDLLIWTRLQKASEVILAMETIDEMEIQTYLKLKFPEDFQLASA